MNKKTSVNKQLSHNDASRKRKNITNVSDVILIGSKQARKDSLILSQCETPVRYRQVSDLDRFKSIDEIQEKGTCILFIVVFHMNVNG